ncbi:MAG: hydrogenase iron-sulfur subunit [Deltaproteobacteria bacterium]|nr:hydrogenase iron-sulfur subunit [Deltaproteobacteria bacterium]
MTAEPLEPLRVERSAKPVTPITLAPPTSLEPGVRADGLLRRGERLFQLLDAALGRFLPVAWNPFLHTGAVAITSLAVATVSGILLLLWYQPSVHGAYASVAAMGEAPLTAGLVRSLHRYSSDAAMLFILVHALRIVFERRFGGARWLAWVTGIAGLGLLWLIGWTGYWLVWDVRAQHIALGSARLLDVLPIFVDPMGRSFLTDEGVNSLLFFVVFFIHMLLPLGLAVALWLHITRLSRPRFLTNRPLTVWLLASLVLVSLASPATNAARARMTEASPGFAMDWWYLAPLALTDRLGGGALWALLLVGGAITFSFPWWMRRRRLPKAFVTTSRCNACRQCFEDCPYNAISMVPRTDGKPFPEQAEVDPAKCVSCGICIASCSTIGTDLEGFGLTPLRRRLEAWVREATEAGSPVHVLFACAESSADDLGVDPETGTCAALPGWRVLAVPCTGWVHSLTVERVLRRGALGVAIAGCAAGSCHFREGDEWLLQRLAGVRAVEVSPEVAESGRVLIAPLAGLRGRALVRALERFAGRETVVAAPPPRRPLVAAAATVLGLAVAAVLGTVADLGYAAPGIDGSELVVSFKHPGAVSEHCRTLSPEELEALPVHMRRPEVCDRARADVRLHVSVDGKPVLDGRYPPSGIWGDGNSVAVEHIPMTPGEHHVTVAIGDTHDPEAWAFQIEETLGFGENARRVLTFDRLAGFRWH